MLTNGPNLGLLIDGDAGEEHYEELMAQWRGFDALIQCVVISATTTAEPGAPSDGDSYIVPVGATGTEWAGNDGKIARWSDKESAWEFYTPREGWHATSDDDQGHYVHDGSDWRLGFILGDVPNASGTEWALWNPSGPVMGGIPTDVAPAFLLAGDGGRFNGRIRVIRAASTPIASFVRAQGTLQSPTAVGNNTDLGYFAFIGYDGTSFVEVGGFDFRSREAFSVGNNGTRGRLYATDIGSASIKAILDWRGGGTNIAEFVSGQATFRFIPSSTGWEWRDSTNAAVTMSLNAAGTTFALPLATSVTFASATGFVVGTDPGGSSLLRVGGGATLSGALQFATSGTIQRTTTTSALTLHGGSSALGGALWLYGQAHATQANDIELRSGTNVRGWWDDSAALWEFSNAASLLTRFSTPAAGETSLWLYDADNATLERVTVGIADSGGAGFKVLRIPN